MATKDKLKGLERERGDLHAVIPPLVNAVGQNEAARILKVSQSTISNWLRNNGYVQQTKYVQLSLLETDVEDTAIFQYIREE